MKWDTFPKPILVAVLFEFCGVHCMFEITNQLRFIQYFRVLFKLRLKQLFKSDDNSKEAFRIKPLSISKTHTHSYYICTRCHYDCNRLVAGCLPKCAFGPVYYRRLYVGRPPVTRIQLNVINFAVSWEN